VVGEPGLVLPRLLLRGLRYGSRFPQGAPQEVQDGIVSPSEVKFDDRLPGQANGSAEFVVRAQKGVQSKKC
jgi:hypothetical protein